MNTNLKGAFFVAQEASKRMVKAGKPGSIINISSILGLRQGTLQTNYGISKSGMIQMTKVMALELTRNSIRCNALAPGYFKTEMNMEFFETKKGKEYLARIPPKRLGELNELDGPFLLLASDQSSFMTGQVGVSLFLGT
jgi:NAD(P)-dependent dehydrogenase (short-subunit alcohol dehydrogenase family)